MDELIKGVKAQLYDRLSSPLSFTFIVSWLLWNFRVVLIVVSSLPPSDKFLALDLLPLRWEHNDYYWLCYGFLFPLAASSLYIFVLPWGEKVVYEYTLLRKKELKLARQRVEEETPLSNEEAREIRGLAEAAYREHDAVLKTRQEEIARLKVELTELKVQLQSPPLQPSDPGETPTWRPKPLDDSQEKLLRIISDAGGVDVSKHMLHTKAGNVPIKVQYDIDELARRSLILEHTANEEDGNYQYDAVSLTIDGRRYLVENLSADLL